MSVTIKNNLDQSQDSFCDIRINNKDKNFLSEDTRQRFHRQLSSNSSFSSNSSLISRINRRFINENSDFATVLKRFKQGSVINKFYPKSKPEKRILILDDETKHLICVKPNTGKPIIESVIDFFDIKEVREGRCSKVFEKWFEEAKKWENNQCFVVLYGNSFCLKNLSCVAVSANECEQWVRCIKNFSQETSNLTYDKVLNRWLKYEFTSFSNERSLVSFKNVKSFFLKQISDKTAISRLKELFFNYANKKNGEINFDDFFQLCYDFFHDPKVFKEQFMFLTKDKLIVEKNELSFFMNNCQKEILNDEQIDKIISNFTTQNIDNLKNYFTENEFIDYLYSKENDIFDKFNNIVNQDMTLPLNYYWVATSHNTYLTGDQFRSESSVEAYVRCLRMGCKCIELDCWDGPDGEPLIYHGHTLTTKIKFIDTIKTIRDYAFVKSDFPLILSIENHCSLSQQRQMAETFKNLLGDYLLTETIDKNEFQMPSPFQLRKKIIIKHKKLTKVSQKTESLTENALKSGIMYLEEDNDLKPFFFILTPNKLSYTDYKSIDENDEDNEDKISLTSREDITEDELHASEPWFHGKLLGKRLQAEELLKQYSYLGDGTFLVRESDTFIGDYSLTFWYNNKANHCRIKSCTVQGKIKYYFVDKVFFDSLFALITHYQTNSLKSLNFTVKLKHPVPQPSSHENKPWYHKKLQRNEAEDLLFDHKLDGSFLVRESEKEDNCFSITFRTNKNIKHCRIKQEDRLLKIGNSTFTNLVELINYYQKNPLYEKTVLKYPINVNNNQQFQPNDDKENINQSENIYLDTNSFSKKVVCKARFEYKSKKEDELSFCENAIITNVNKDRSDWWRGDYNGKKQLLFPKSHVIELDDDFILNEDDQEERPLKNLEKDFINLADCIITLPPTQNKKFTFKIFSQEQKTLELTVTTEADFNDWLSKIQEAKEAVDNKIRRSMKIEQKEKVAKELSDLIVYCRSVPFVNEKFGHYTEMCSFNESKAEKIISSSNFIHKFNLKQITRVYPHGLRVDSSNFNPTKFWNVGVQLTALNYQTPDKAMQLNQSMFLQNGGCGYVLRPKILLDPLFDLTKLDLNENSDKLVIYLKVVAGRHLTKNSKNAISPYVEIEVLGVNIDHFKDKTSTINDNGLNPVWNETFFFNVHFPELAFLRFVVYDVDTFGDSSFVAQATYPLKCLRTGYRSVSLKNEFSEEFELAALLVNLEIKSINNSENSLKIRHENLDKQLSIKKF